MEIRAFSEPDRPEVIALWQKTFGHYAAHNDPARDIDRKMAVQPELFFVAIIDGKIAGTAMAGDDGHRGWVHRVAVHPDYRRRGVGTALMLVVEEALAARNCIKINLQVAADNAAVTGFYKSLGYNVEERISMGKRLEG